MILFKPEHVSMILEGRKTQTRRLGKKRWNEGSVHQAKTTLFGEPFARVRITGVRHDYLHAISEADIRREGYDTAAQFLEKFREINGGWAPNASVEVWVVDFDLVKEEA